MNYERGLFRLWALGSAVFAIFMLVTYLPKLRSEIEWDEISSVVNPATQLKLVPVEGDPFAGVASPVNAPNETANSAANDPIPKGFVPVDIKSIKLDQNVQMPDGTIQSFPGDMPKTQVKNIIVRSYMFFILTRAIFLPLCILLFGRSLIWVIKGFNRERSV